VLSQNRRTGPVCVPCADSFPSFTDASKAPEICPAIRLWQRCDQGTGSRDVPFQKGRTSHNGYGRVLILGSASKRHSDAATNPSSRRAAIEAFIKKTGAQLWIEHDLAHFNHLKKAPSYYELT